VSVHPIILCGGSGTRLWPASRPSRPKQFALLLGERSTFQTTVIRLAGIADAARLTVVAGPGHVDLIRRQLGELGVAADLLIEPAGRDSAPAIAAATRHALSQDPHAVCLVTPADHDLPDSLAFAAAVARASVAAGAGSIVTFGVRPSSPSTAYGYIRAGEPLQTAGVFEVAAFREKPPRSVAEAYLRDGFLWNSGNFAFQGATMLAELERLAPDVASAAASALDQAVCIGGVLWLGPAFLQSPKISIDYAVLEKTSSAAVIAVDFQWSDLGAWDAVLAASDRDRLGNAAPADAVLVDCADSLVRARNLAVIAEPDAVLVCDLDSSQSVKIVAERLGAAAPATTGASDLERRLADLSAAFDIWLRASALPLWATVGADATGWGFHEAIDMDGRPIPGPRRLRVQARQTYVYAQAGAEGWEGPWASLVLRGLEGIETRYRRIDGAYRTLVQADGEVVDQTAMLYDQAFVLLAGAAAAHCGLCDGLDRAARALLAGPLQARRHDAGGFLEAAGASPFQSNPHMHLLEAALAWESEDPAGPWRSLADEIVTLALERFIDPDLGCLREVFAADWRCAEGSEGRLIEPGHQFEWAWLLERWGERRGEPRARHAARALFDVGAVGVEPFRGVAIDTMRDDLSPARKTARLWPQTERLKAALRLARRRDAHEQTYLAHAVSAATTLQRYLAAPVAGAWRDRLDGNGDFLVEPAPASSLYHLVGAVQALASHSAETTPRPAGRS
jgi:mannose-1-phosphate guanylyltransferase/mannose-6-phosphate isomerase